MAGRALFPILLATVLGIAACHSAEPPSTGNEQAPAAAEANQAVGDPVAFQPLQSDQVKDAIHRALVTGETQRWQDKDRSGYAVPSQAADKHGCRAVRYTVDQRPDVPFESITACEANRPNP